jgi:hypothetical protein
MSSGQLKTVQDIADGKIVNGEKPTISQMLDASRILRGEEPDNNNLSSTPKRKS